MSDTGGDIGGDTEGHIPGHIGDDIEGDIPSDTDGDIESNIRGDTESHTEGDILGDIGDDIEGDILGDIGGDIKGDIPGVIPNVIEGIIPRRPFGTRDITDGESNLKLTHKFERDFSGGSRVGNWEWGTLISSPSPSSPPIKGGEVLSEHSERSLLPGEENLQKPFSLTAENLKNPSP